MNRVKVLKILPRLREAVKQIRGLAHARFLIGLAKARKLGRFAWHYEAVISAKIRREVGDKSAKREKPAC
jgi:hypothetical protein